MAAQPSSFFTLTGFLELLTVKPKARKDKKHRYWFMLDESKCELRYFEKHTDDLHTPVGSIPMSNARLSLSVQGREEGVRTVVVSVGNSEYHLIAPSVKDAQNWYRKIQEKTEASRKLANQPSTKSASQRPQSMQVPVRSRFSMFLPTSTAPPLPMKGQSFAEGTDFGGCPDVSSLDKPGAYRRSAMLRSMSAEDIFHAEEDGSSTPPPVRPLVPGAESVNADTPTAVIHPQTIDQLLSTDDSPTAEPPPLPPKSSHWKANTPDVSGPIEDSSRPLSFQIRPSVKQPASLDLKRAVSISTKVYYNVVPEYPKGKLQTEADYIKKLEHLQLQLESERTITHELRTILDKITKVDPEVSSTRRQNTLDELLELKRTNCELESVIATLNEEQRRSQESQRQFDSKMEEEQARYHSLQLELNHWKARYIKLLGNQMEIPIGNLGFGPAVAPAREDQEQRREVEMMLRADCLEEEMNNLFSEPGTLCDFQDECGDTYYAENDSLTYHFLVRRLYRQYTEDQVEELSAQWGDLCERQAGRDYLDLNGDKRKEEVRQLLWKGLPMANKCRKSRVKLWESCIHRLVGDKKRYLDEQSNSKTYYQNLLDIAESTEDPHSKQISLDLPRTLPYNVHFKPETDAISKMSNVLHAFCHHAPKIGYTQGMNLLVAISLFHLDEESAFWCLVAILERILPPDYYTHGLLASQADQAVFQNLVEKEMPVLHKHMTKYGIDVTLVTLNWFLTIFADALPTEAVIRMWDLFLLDGRPVLFNFALALLRVHESKLLRIHDAVNLLQFLKNMSRHTFDVELMFQEVQQTYRTVKMTAFINKRYDDYYRKLKNEFQKREKERRIVEEQAREKMAQFERRTQEAASRREGIEAKQEDVEVLVVPQVHQRLFTVGTYFRPETPRSENPKWLASCACNDNEVLLVFQYPNGDISTTSVSVGASVRMKPVEAKLPKKPTAMHYHCPSELVLVGTLDFQLIAFSHQSLRQLWSCTMKDSILDITSLGSSVFVGLADGSIAKLSNVSESEPQLAPELLTVSTDTRSSAVPSIVAMEGDNTIWCAAGNAITIVDAVEMQRLESINTGMPQKNLVNHLCLSQYGVWATYKSSTVVSLYSIDDHSRLFHMDYKTAVYRKEVPDPSESTGLDLRITGFLINGEYVWIGTGGGSVILFTVVRLRSKMKQLQRKTVSSSAVVQMQRKRARSTLPGLLMQDAMEESGSVSMRTFCANVVGVNVEELQPRTSSLPDSPNTVLRRKTSSLRTVCTSKDTGIKEDMYTLEFVWSSSIAKSADHVRKLLAFDSERAHRVMACVRASNDEPNPIQIWNCDQADPQKWFPRPLDC